jgi:hypothetical protein
MTTLSRISQIINIKKVQNRKYTVRFIVGVFAGGIFVFTGCQAVPVVESNPIESATIVQPTSLPTRVQTTEVPTLAPSDTPVPTETATITPTLKPQLGPEELATTFENVAGKWAFTAIGDGENDPAILTLTMDGLTSMDGVGGYLAGMNLGVGKYWFEDNVMVIYSEDCEGLSGIFTCTANYKVYFSMGENGVGSLRFAAIDDPHQDRKKSLHGKTLFPAVVE